MNTARYTKPYMTAPPISFLSYILSLQNRTEHGRRYYANDIGILPPFFSFRCSTTRANVYKRQAGIWIRRLLREWRARQSWEIPRRSNNVLTSILAQTAIKGALYGNTVTEYRAIKYLLPQRSYQPVSSIICSDICTVFILNTFLIRIEGWYLIYN